MVVHVLILWSLVLLALAIAFLVERRRKELGKPFHLRTKGGEKPEYQVALGFVASSYGLLLGLLVAFGTNHYADVRNQAQNEADSLLALWDTVTVYPPQIRDPARHDLICYMRAIRDDDWPSMERGSRAQSPRGVLFGDRLRATILDLPEDSSRESSAYGRAASLEIDADKSRQQLLFFTQSRVPAALWVVIYVGAFLLFLLITMHYAGRPPGRIVSLGSVVTLLTVVVVVLSALDQPYGAGARVGPTALSHAIDLVNPGHVTTGVFAPCPTPRI